MNVKEIEVNEITNHLFTHKEFKISQASWGFLNETIVLSSVGGEMMLVKYP